MVANI